MYLDTNLIEALKSTTPTRIHFPYDWEKAAEEDQWEITRAVFESGVEVEEIKDFAVYALIMPSKRKIVTGFQIDIIDNHGKAYRKRIAADADPEEICKILKVFFTSKAPGLDDEYRLCLHRYFDQYVMDGDRQRGTIALNILKAGGTVDDVITALLPYKGMARVF